MLSNAIGYMPTKRMKPMIPSVARICRNELWEPLLSEMSAGKPTIAAFVDTPKTTLSFQCSIVSLRSSSRLDASANDEESEDRISMVECESSCGILNVSSMKFLNASLTAKTRKHATTAITTRMMRTMMKREAQRGRAFLQYVKYPTARRMNVKARNSIEALDCESMSTFTVELSTMKLG